MIAHIQGRLVEKTPTEVVIDCKSSDFTEQEKCLFLGENARKFYGFGSFPEISYIKNMSE